MNLPWGLKLGNGEARARPYRAVGKPKWTSEDLSELRAISRFHEPVCEDEMVTRLDDDREVTSCLPDRLGLASISAIWCA